MKISSTTRAAATVLALSGAVAFGGSVAAAPAASAAPTKAPAACAAKGCTVVAHTDVDGDGRKDTVSITPTRAHGSKAMTLRVVTARKAVAQNTYTVGDLMTFEPWFGAAAIDGAKGNELVVRTGFGAHYQGFAVFSWRGGKLVAQRDPNSGGTEWTIDSAYTVTQGYTVTTSRGRRVLTVRLYMRDETSGNYFNGKAVNYTWRNGGWHRSGSSTVRVHAGSPKIDAAFGWHVPGLPVA